MVAQARSDRANRPDAHAGHQVHDQVERVHVVRPRQQSDQAVGVGHPGRLEAGHHQHRVTDQGQDEQGQAFERHGPVPGQPRQVGPVGEQEGVDADASMRSRTGPAGTSGPRGHVGPSVSVIGSPDRHRHGHGHGPDTGAGAEAGPVEASAASRA